MTCIAYRNSVMAADSLVVNDNAIKDLRSIKILSKGGWLLGTSGELCPPDHTVLKWFKPKAMQLPRMDGYKFFMLAAGPKGVLRVWDQEGQFEPIRNRFWAVGSGSELAMGAMEMGATAAQAVAVAIKFNVNCDGKIITRRLKAAAP